MSRIASLTAAFVLATISASPAAAEEDYPLLGQWDCEVGTFTFTADTYDTGSEVLPIQDVQEGTDGSWTLMFADDDMITLSGFTDRSMGWYSPASGDAFTCTRLDD